MNLCISRHDDEDIFQLYIDKSYNKTASLLANSCKSVALLAAEDTGDDAVTVRNVVIINLIEIFLFRAWLLIMEEMLGLHSR